jgi:phosphomannomutase / phosphoglucomutase
MKSNIFREYDIRGIVGNELPVNEVYNLSKAIVSYFLKNAPGTKKIIIGMDGRTHGPEIKKEAIKAAQDMGLDVVDIGIVPTPVFYFSLFTTEIPTGFIITASHNPKAYNGFKMCMDKKSVWGTQVQEIKRIYQTENYAKPIKKELGSIEDLDIITPYIQWLSDHFSHLKGKSVDAIIDCGNGTAGTVIPRLIEAMELKNTKVLYEEIDGTFPNHDADPTTLKNMLDVQKELSINDNYMVGLGFDGDCDRMNPMSKKGILVPGDKMVSLYSKKIIKKNPGATIIFDIKSSSSLLSVLEEWGANPRFSPSGHSIIKNNLFKHNALLAGELSCHFFFNDIYFGYDDGIYASLRLLEIIEEEKKNLDELLSIFPKQCSSPEYRITCKEEDKVGIVDHVKSLFATRTDAELITIDGIRAHTDYGWGLIRASNTQPAICLRFESPNESGLEKITNEFIEALAPYFSSSELKEYFDS